MQAQAHKVVFEKRGDQQSEVTVCVTLYNYARFIREALDSVREQDIDRIDLVIVDDSSTDNSVTVTRRWMARHAMRFNNVTLVRHQANHGLSAARNTAFSLSRTAFCFSLDADNVLYPPCLGRCLEAILASDAACAYPIVEVFGARSGLVSVDLWAQERFHGDNYIDAMALIRKAAWRAVGGYSKAMMHGWEDYDLWCSFVEADFVGVRVPEILARYRDHTDSMLQQVTNQPEIRRQLVEQMRRRHPWLRIQA